MSALPLLEPARSAATTSVSIVSLRRRAKALLSLPLSNLTLRAPPMPGPVFPFRSSLPSMNCLRRI